MEKQQMLPTVQMDRKTLGGQMVIALSQIMELFDEKNNRYGSDDALMNFRKMVPALQMWIPDLTEINGMYLANEFLADKHRVTMLHHGVYDPKFEESCMDRILYLLIVLVQYREWVEQSEENSQDLLK